MRMANKLFLHFWWKTPNTMSWFFNTWTRNCIRYVKKRNALWRIHQYYLLPPSIHLICYVPLKIKMTKIKCNRIYVFYYTASFWKTVQKEERKKKMEKEKKRRERKMKEEKKRSEETMAQRGKFPVYKWQCTNGPTLRHCIAPQSLPNHERRRIWAMVGGGGGTAT